MTVAGRKFPRHQRGVSIILVLFLLVVVSALVISVTRLSDTQAMNTSYSYMSTQSYFAARAGVEWGVSRVVGTGCGGANGNVQVAGYSVDVTCTDVGGPYNEGDPGSYSMYRITATAGRGGFAAPDASTRVVTTTIRN